MPRVPTSWMPAAQMTRIHLHWTGGRYEPNSADRNAYHLLVDGDGQLVRGDKSIKANEPGSSLPPASHTLNANSGAIGISICSMGGRDVHENPFQPGSYPITPIQWNAAIGAIADLAKRYAIPVTPVTILTHAEVQPNLGIKQKNKWDITRLVFEPSLIGARPIGDKMRREVTISLDDLKPQPPSTPPDELKLQRYRVVGVKPSTLNWRTAPNGRVVSAVQENTILEKLGEDGLWWRVRSPKGYEGWVYSAFLVPI